MLVAIACRKPAPQVVVPAVFRVNFETSQGDIVVEARREWAPHGVDRFHELVRMRYFDQGRFFRVLPGFIAQFGVHRNMDVHATWSKLFIVDDPPRLKNVRGTLAFAQSGPDLPVDLRANRRLDGWIRIDVEGTVTIFTGKVELGQGILTALSQIAADELDVDFARVRMISDSSPLSRT